MRVLDDPIQVHPVTWTDERTDALRKLWADGLTCSQIAAELGGISRNAVIGKVHRLKLPGRRKRVAARHVKPATVLKPVALAPRRSLRVGPSLRLRLDDQTPIEVLADPVGITIMELTVSTCRWPLGDPRSPSFRYCGCQTREGSPYCPAHHRLSHMTRAEWEAEQASAIEKATAPAKAMEAA